MITVNGLTKTLGDRPVLCNVTFAVRDGSVTGFVGPNGAGKTTTMKIAVGLLAANSGQVLFDGRPYRSLSSPFKHIGSLLDPSWLISDLRARDLLAYCASTQRLTCNVNECLEKVGLGGMGARRVCDLSLGMRQRLGVGLALIGSPRNLILDEPLNGLDPAGVAWMRSTLTALRQGGAAILLSSHIISELALIADDVVILDHGSVVLSGAIEDIQRSSGHAVVARAQRPERLVAAVHKIEGTAARSLGDQVTITGLHARQVFRLAVERGLTLSELTTRQRSLDSIYAQAVNASPDNAGPDT